MEVSSIIFGATEVCLQSFTNCLTVEVLSTNEWAENRLADFNLWVSGIGALARGRASLDSRLALQPDIVEVIANLLHLLAGLVDECKNIGQVELPFSSGHPLIGTWDLTAILPGPDPFPDSSHDGELRGRPATSPSKEPPIRSFSPWSDDSVSDTETDYKPLLSSNPLHERMRDIEVMLDQLARIAVAVRLSGRRTRLHKADQRFRLEEHKDLQKHLATILLARPEFSKEQIDPSRLNEVQQRLVYCNLKRRNRFIYAQQHSKWLENTNTARLPSQVQPIESIKTPSQTKRDTAKEKQKSPPPNVKSSSGAADAPINPTLRTGTSASAVSDSPVPGILIPAPAASTVMSSTVVNLKYPSPPKVKQGARVFKCPCCCQTLPLTFLEEKNRWKKHVADDLCPYTCILSDCPRPDILFVTKENWRQHLLKEHQSLEYWVCFACGENSQFHSKDDFISHTRTKHADSVPLDQIPLLTDVCRRSAPVEINACPLCHESEHDECGVDRDVLLDHIAKHVHSFSLRALPWADNNGQESDERIKHSTDKVYDWLIENNLSKNPGKERPSLEKQSNTSEYFHRNLYFASSSVASSSTQSVASCEEELKNWKQREGSLSFGSRGSGVLLRKEADNEDRSHETEFRTDRSAELCMAAEEGREEMVQMLLDRGADANAPSAKFGHPLQAASYRGHEEVVQILLSNGADVNAQGGEYGNALEAASYRGHVTIVRMLLNCGADVNAQDEKFGNALQAALKEGHEEIVRMLLHSGADLDSMANLAAIYQTQGQWHKAEKLYERALEGIEKAWGPEHTFTLDIVNDLGNLYADQGKVADAETMYRWALKGFENAYGSDSVALSIANNLGTLYADKRQMAEAMKMYQRALKGKMEAYGPEHESTLITFNNLGNLYASQGDMAEAVTMYLRAQAGFENRYGPKHPHTLITFNNLGILYARQGNRAMAATIQQEVLQERRFIYGIEHPATITAMNNLAWTFTSQGRLEEAASMQQEVLKMSRRVRGEQHPATITAVDNLANTLRYEGRHGEATLMQREVYNASGRLLTVSKKDLNAIHALRASKTLI